MTTAADPLLEIDRLTIRRHAECLLDDVTLKVARGSLRVIVGPNGAGKSTLVTAVLGLVPFDGRIMLNWMGAGTTGYVPQNFAVDPTLPVTVEDFLALTRQRRPVCLGVTASVKSHIARLLDRVGLGGLALRPLAVLSGGELRRVLLAHALDPEPELLILDEPTTGLDEDSARWLEDTLAGIRREGRVTTVMISHDLEQSRRLADEVTVLDRHVVATGAADAILATTSIRDLLPAGASGRRVR